MEAYGTENGRSDVALPGRPGSATSERPFSVPYASMRKRPTQVGPRDEERRRVSGYAAAPWHFLYFFPLPHGQGSFRPTFGSSRRMVFTSASSPPTRAG